jgi:hypothetical protein
MDSREPTKRLYHSSIFIIIRSNLQVFQINKFTKEGEILLGKLLFDILVSNLYYILFIPLTVITILVLVKILILFDRYCSSSQGQRNTRNHSDLAEEFVFYF